MTGSKIIKNSIRQLWRMKGKTALFLLLLLFASGLFSLGRSFWSINLEKTKAYENSFMTIGVVEQKPDTMTERKSWDAGIQDYRRYIGNVYSSYLPVSVLDFEGADYLSGPEKRVCYGAYMPEYEMHAIGESATGLRYGFIIEASPVEDAVPDHPITIRVSKIWKGAGIREGDTIRLCDHYNPAPKMLYKDKTYVMAVYDVPGHESDLEFNPDPRIRSTQVGPDGKYLPDEVDEDYFYEEVTDDFWESERSRRWRNLMKVWDYGNHIFPVTGTGDIHLMMPFYNNEVAITSGRDFTEEEYENGEKVCIISEYFAGKYGFKLGDQIELPLLIADHYRSAGRMYGSSGGGAYNYLNAKGEPYEVFEDSLYTITGMYSGKFGLLTELGMGYNEIIIPANSVKNSGEDNMVDMGPMNSGTTSFQIENGTIEEYMEKWNRQGIDNVEITFYDKGYTELEANINHMSQISRILILAGAAMVLMVLGYFSWIFILRQRERTAIERSLGFRKSQSFLSLFSGIFLLMVLGSFGGCAGGGLLSEAVAGDMGQTVYYDTTFGNSAPGSTEAVTGEDTKVLDTKVPFQDMFLNVFIILAAGSAIAGTGIYMNLKQEPMKMFGSRKE